MRRRLALCRGLFLVVVAGAGFLGVNLALVLTSHSPQPHVSGTEPCVCECTERSASPRSLGSVTTQLISPISGTTPQKEERREEDWVGSPHQLAVVVPFRNRFEELLEFAPYMHRFLDRQNTRHQIWVVNQVDSHRFNRASLLNIGFILSRNSCDYIAMHDVDLLPVNDALLYSYPQKGPLHISSPQLHPLYHYKTFVGGILLLTREQFERVNGLSNIFWGWGREDDELYLRMKEAGMKVQSPQGITTGYKTFRHIHDRKKRPRDQKQLFNQWEISRKRDRVTGLSTVVYKLESTVELSIDGTPVHFVNVKLDCDYEKTPFCDNTT